MSHLKTNHHFSLENKLPFFRNQSVVSKTSFCFANQFIAERTVVTIGILEKPDAESTGPFSKTGPRTLRKIGPETFDKTRTLDLWEKPDLFLFFYWRYCGASTNKAPQLDQYNLSLTLYFIEIYVVLSCQPPVRFKINLCKVSEYQDDDAEPIIMMYHADES